VAVFFFQEETIMQRIVINNCHGGFNLSVEATELLYQRGAPIGQTPVEEYFGSDLQNHQDALAEWQAYKATGNASANDFFLVIFSADERLVLDNRSIARDDPTLIQIVEELGPRAAGRYAQLRIVEIPDGVDWQIEEYDGAEWVAEKHRTWP
jgi:hypothetical protein